MIKAVNGLMFHTERLTIQALDYAGEKLGFSKKGHMVYKTLGMNVENARKIFTNEYGDKIIEEDLAAFQVN